MTLLFSPTPSASHVRRPTGGDTTAGLSAAVEGVAGGLRALLLPPVPPLPAATLPLLPLLDPAGARTSACTAYRLAGSIWADILLAASAPCAQACLRGRGGWGQEASSGMSV